MKRAAATACLFLCLSALLISCGKEKEEPKVVRQEASPSARLAENGKALSALAEKMDALIKAVVPDRQHTAMIVIKENIEKAALVSTYESMAKEGPAAPGEKPGPKASGARTGRDALARFSEAATKALADVHNNDAIKMAGEADAIMKDSALILGQGSGLAVEAKTMSPATSSDQNTVTVKQAAEEALKKGETKAPLRH